MPAAHPTFPLLLALLAYMLMLCAPPQYREAMRLKAPLAPAPPVAHEQRRTACWG